MRRKQLISTASATPQPPEGIEMGFYARVKDVPGAQVTFDMSLTDYQEGKIVLVVRRIAPPDQPNKDLGFKGMGDVYNFMRLMGPLARSISLEPQPDPNNEGEGDQNEGVVEESPQRRKGRKGMPKAQVPAKPIKLTGTKLEELKPKLEETRTSGALQSHGIPPETARNFGREFENLFLLVTASKRRIKSLPMMEKTKRRVEEVLKQISPLLELGGMKFDAEPKPAKKPQPLQKGDPKKEDLHNVLNEDISVLEKFGLPKKVVENLMAPKGYDMHHIGDLMELSGDDLSTGKTVKEKKRKLKKNEVGLVKSSLAKLGKNRQIDLLLGMNRQEWVPPATRDSGTAAQAAAETGQQGPV